MAPTPTGLGLAFNAANEGFVSFDHVAFTAHGIGANRAHGLTDAMGNEPCSLESAAKSTMQLVAADALFARRHEEDRLQPVAHGDVAGFEDGPNLHSEGLPADVTLVSADPGALAFHLGNPFGPLAMWTYRTMRPKP